MLPYAPYAISIPITSYVYALEVLLGACVIYWLVAVAKDRRRVHAAAPAPVGHRLRQRLRHSRLAKMLRRLQVNPTVYLRRTPPAVIQAQLDTCAACPHQFLCDQALASDGSADLDLSFCPNRLAVIPLARAA